MDIRCIICGEPWDLDELRYIAEEEGLTYSKVRADFFSRGCVVLGANPCRATESGMVAGLIADLMGDDLDGMASMLDDAEYLGLI